MAEKVMDKYGTQDLCLKAWARGTNDIIETCKEAGLPEPIIEENQGGLSVVFLKDIYTEDYLRTLDINERQVKAILYAKENGGSIVSSEYQELNGVKRTLATEELVDLVTKGLLEKKGSIGRSSKYYIRTLPNYR